MNAPTTQAIGLMEIGSWTAAIAALDAAEKSAGVRLLQGELNDMMGASFKIVGSVADVDAALSAANAVAVKMRASSIVRVMPRPAAELQTLLPVADEFNALIEQNVIYVPRKSTMADTSSTQAIGLIETQGFTAVIEAIDTACKAANVEIAGREKLGGGFICVVIRGDVAAVKAAVAAGSAKVEGLGKLIAAHVIARPSASVLGLLPK